MSERAAPRAVVATNVFISGVISPGGRPSRLLDLWLEGWFELLLSNEQHTELADVLSRPKVVQSFRLGPTLLTDLYAGLAAATRVMPSPSIPVSLRDPNDVPILAAALGGNADYLVTGDNDLLIHKDDPRLGNLQIVTVLQFLAVLDRDS